MPRPIRALVKPSAIDYNLQRIRAINPAWHCMPVVKAHAYGHGLERLLSGLQSADSLAILEIEGAAALRKLGWSKPIVLLEGCFDSADVEQAVALGLDWVVHDHAHLQAVVDLADRWLDTQHAPRIFLKLNTGMNRLGFTVDTAPAVIEQLDALARQMEWPVPVLMTHFANADAQQLVNARPSAQAQFEALMALKPAHWFSSLANSAGVLNCPEWAGDIVRPGIAIYGATPGPKTALEYGLKPAMSLRSQVIAIQTVAVGERVGYGSRWQATRSSRIGVVACGYADGYPRHAPDGTPVVAAGQRVPLAGRVSMDMLTIDITDAPQVQLGSDVELWGEALSIDEVAEHAGTIGYELMCALAPRVPVTVVEG
ncbi:alanine racemase [Limnobacter humi]|uniref:Alanine racemase n=1 Tax=Limnobacter humi TaxID=1778671 RepID=A0ABT1WFB8_9BURK|nr:alanine racemase [Limnobacter humi]MCQ8896216.1 alanine racemase [Limnobacter humi]